MYNYNFIQPTDLKVRQINTNGISPIAMSMCYQMFPQYQFTNEFVVYYEKNNQTIVLGILHIFENKIENSKYFSTFQYNSIVIDNTNPTELSTFKTYQIDYWWFDEILRNIEFLNTIFSIISYILGEKNKTVLLWRDGESELEYYPISNENVKFPIGSLGRYFAERFINN